uniref:Uncharacterized protein n=1 Tax=Anguilla anguilla TaxID=7936 RepID=A0A0E9QAC2_ANGAN
MAQCRCAAVLFSRGSSYTQHSPSSWNGLVSHWTSFSFLSRASALCFSSKRCFASVAASMSLSFRLVVTSFHSRRDS